MNLTRCAGPRRVAAGRRADVLQWGGMGWPRDAPLDGPKAMRDPRTWTAAPPVTDHVQRLGAEAQAEAEPIPPRQWYVRGPKRPRFHVTSRPDGTPGSWRAHLTRAARV